MGMPTEQLLDTADILGTKLENHGEYSCTLGELESGKGWAKGVPAGGFSGVVSIPDPPDETGACVANFIRDGNDTLIIGTRDLRYAERLGALPAGTRGFLTRGEARVLLNPETDSIFISTVNKKADLQQAIVLDATEGQTTHLCGNTAITQTDEEITFVVNGGASLRLSKDGVFITGNVFVCCTATAHIGDMGGGTPPPNTPVNGAGMGTSPAVAASTKVFLAP